MFGQTEEDHFLYQVLTSGRHFLSFWGPINSESRGNRDCGAKNNQANPNKLKDYLIDVYDRSTNQKGRFLTCASHLNTKPSFSKITDRFDRRYTFSSMFSNEKVYLFKSAHFILS